MSDEPDAVLEAVLTLWAAGIAVTPTGDEPERWQVGDLTFSDIELLRLAESCGLGEAA